MPSLIFEVKHKPVLDEDFCPAALWNRTFRNLVMGSGRAVPLSLALVRKDDTVSVFQTAVLPHEGEYAELNQRYVERLVKFLLWQKGGYRIGLSGDPRIADFIAGVYGPGGKRAFDFHFMGEKVYDHPMEIQHCPAEDMPAPREAARALGRHFNGCRVGFDLGGSDRKSAALIDGRVVFSEEVPWNPSFEKNPSYHIQGIDDSIRRAAEKLPRVDAIGGSAAGIYINNEARVASLFRGIGPDDFKKHIRGIFLELKKRWNNVPFEVINDGEVTALAGSIAMNDNAVLGISMGSSQAAGYVTPEGTITPWLNELAFVPVDYRPDAPADEWSGDVGCGVQYFSQQAVARLAAKAGLDFPPGMALSERLAEVQSLMKSGDARAVKIFESIGVYFGYAVAHYADFYEFRNLLVLGRVTSGPGGELIIDRAKAVLGAEFPELSERIRMRTPDERDKRLGQAVAAASLPVL
jgi:predicted NBD/HSP70 family sugar kinase